MKSSKKILAAGVAAVAISMLSACGGGGGSSPAPAPTPTPTPSPTPTGSGISWTQGVFEPAVNFEARCETPRSGVDIEGNAFSDIQGSLEEELFWLRSWTNETYLFNDEVLDQDPGLFDDRLDYFAELKTFAVTASGEDKDDFHFSQPTEDYLEQRNSAPLSGYGVEYAIFQGVPPRDVRVLFTDPDTPASTPGGDSLAPFLRGAQILEVDGVDLVNDGTQAGVDALNAALFPATAGETHEFVVQDVGAASTRTVSITSEDLPSVPVNRTAVIDTPTGKVGYILFNTFSPLSSEAAIAEAITEMKNEGVSDLVLDLRYNGGGLLTVASQLAYMIAGDAQTNGKTFELLQFNDDAGNINPVTGGFNEPVPFIDIGVGFSLTNNTPLDSLDLDRVYILSTENTCSASEAVINGLSGVDVEIVLIGAVTCGKPYGFYPTDNCGETYYSIQFQGVNDKGFGDYADGFVPNDSSFGFGVRLAGCEVADDLSADLGDVEENLLETALAYRDTGACPDLSATSEADGDGRLAPASARAPVRFKDQSGAAIATTGLTRSEYIRRNNRDMRSPR